MDQHITIKINEEIVPHNGKPITRIAVSPQSKYVVTYSQEDKSFVGWRNNNKDNQEDKNRKKNHNQNKSLYNLKKYANYKYMFKIAYYKFASFLTNGDLATYNIIIENKRTTSKPVILIYSSNTIKENNWMCKSIYELDKINIMKINFGGMTNDVLWMLSNNTIFVLDLIKFQYRKILVEINVRIIIV